MSNCVIIIGAGASIEFVNTQKLTNALIMQKLQAKKAWSSFLEKHLKPQETEEIISYITSCIERVKREDDNFEDIIEIVDKACTLSNSHKFSNSLLIRTIDYITKGKLTASKDKHLLINIPFYIREFIAEQISEYNIELGGSDESLELLNLQHEFIKELKTIFGSVSIHSLNYDDCISRSLDKLEINSGFDEFGNFNKDTYQSANNVLSYLHGTPHFIPEFIFLSGSSSIVRYEKDCERAAQERWRLSEIHPGLLTKGKNCPDYNHYITTGQSKNSHFYNQPYASYYTRLTKDLGEADIIFIIGYSFGDEHINQLLASAQNYANPKVFVIIDFDDPNPEGNEDRIREKLHNIINKLDVLYFENASKKQFEIILEQLKHTAFAKIQSDIYYYNKGYSTFLNEDIRSIILNDFAPFV